MSVLYHFVSLHCYRLNKRTFYRRLHSEPDLLLILTSVSGERTGAEKCINDNVRDERYIISYLHTIVYCAITSLDVFLEKYNKDCTIQSNKNQVGPVLLTKLPQLQQTDPSGTIEVSFMSLQSKFLNYSLQWKDKAVNQPKIIGRKRVHDLKSPLCVPTLIHLFKIRKINC